jgi:hypothetical protein
MYLPQLRTGFEVCWELFEEWPSFFGNAHCRRFSGPGPGQLPHLKFAPASINPALEGLRCLGGQKAASAHRKDQREPTACF